MKKTIWSSAQRLPRAEKPATELAAEPAAEQAAELAAERAAERAAELAAEPAAEQLVGPSRFRESEPLLALRRTSSCTAGSEKGAK